MNGRTLKDSDVKEHPMYVIGKIVALDILLNNPDRIPSIWPNPGNPRNFMVEA